MRLAYVCTDPGVPIFGRKGASVHVSEVVHALTKAGAEVTILASSIHADSPSPLKGVRVLSLPRPRLAPGGHRELALVESNDTVAAALAAHGPFDAVYERHALFSYGAMEFARAAGVPGLLEVNAPLVQEQARYRDLRDARVGVEAERRAFTAADCVIAVSDAVAEHVRGVRGSRAHVHVIPNGVDPERFRPDVPPAIPPVPGLTTVGFVGTLKPWHGVRDLGAAFVMLRASGRRARLLVVGDGPERPALEAALGAAGLLGDAIFTGSVDSSAVPAYLTSMNVAVAPYPVLEGFYFSPLKLLEYMAAGRAVVASRIGQIAQVVTDGEDGVLCTPGDPAGLSRALARLHDQPEERPRLGAAARQSVVREHTWDRVAQRLLRLAMRPPMAPCCAEAR